MVRAAFFWTLSVALAAPSSEYKMKPSDQNALFIEREIFLQLLVDQLYGEVVRTDQSDAFRYRKLETGELNLPEPVIQPSFLSYERLMESPESLMLEISKIRSTQERTSRAAAHSGYLRLRDKLNLPHEDDTTDLSSGKTMFGGILTFGGFQTFDCYDPALYDTQIDIAIVGAPFDTGTSYRPGARFGPEAIRLGGRRLKDGITPVRTNGPGSKLGKINPYNPKSHNLSIVDCGDVPMTPFDNRVALNQLYRGQRAIHNHTTSGAPLLPYPKILTMGGDHTISLMALRSTYEKYGRLAVLHFDSHIDTWNPKLLGGGITDYMSLNHGTFLHYAAENGYLESHKCFHLGLRAPYIDASYDKQHDEECGFNTITARDIDKKGTAEILRTLKETLGNIPVYISVDIDVLDPAYAPGTGTMEVGGWTTRELLTMIDGLEGLNVVGADVVEVSPPFDTNSEITSLAATAVMDSILGLFIVQSLE